MGSWKISGSRWVVAVIFAGLVGWLYYRFDPAHFPFPKCPFLTLTGYKCPGCGSQRALHNVLHGKMQAAGGSNFLFLASLPYVLFGLVLEYTGWGRQQILVRRRWYGYRATVATLVIVLLFWVARNVWGF